MRLPEEICKDSFAPIKTVIIEKVPDVKEEAVKKEVVKADDNPVEGPEKTEEKKVVVS